MALVDFLFIIPLDEEWESIRPILAPKSVERPYGTVTYYFWKHGNEKDDKSNCYLNAAVSMGNMGLVAAGISVTRALSLWQPAYAALLGIAGSLVPKEHQLGDVVVSDEVYGYEVGSVSGWRPKFRFRQTGHQPSMMLWDRIRALKSDSETYRDWQNECMISPEARELQKITPKMRPPEIHRGITASGNFVVKSRAFARDLRKQIDDRICAVEMEGKGHFEAVHSADEETGALMVRGISDYANGEKSKLDKESKGAWRRFAAANAARLMEALLRRGSIRSIPVPTFCIRLEDRNDRLRKEQISLLDANTQNMDFSLLTNVTPVPAITTLDVYGLRNTSTPVTPNRVACIHYYKDKATRFERIAGNDKATFSLPRADDAVEIAILLAFETPIEQVEVKILDEFNRDFVCDWKPKT